MDALVFGERATRWQFIVIDTEAEFDALVRRSFEGLPEVYRDACQGLTIRTEPQASAEVMTALELLDPYELLGLYLPGVTSYYVNTNGAPDGALGEVSTAFDAWDDVTAADLFLDAVATTVSGIKLDTQNTVSWVKIVPRNIIAMVSIWYEDDSNPLTLDPVVEFDMVFNALLKWGIDTDGEGEEHELDNAFDVLNIATHEVGHVAGLADLYEEQYRQLTMYGYGGLTETLKISLEVGDIAGVQEIYGGIN